MLWKINRLGISVLDHVDSYPKAQRWPHLLHESLFLGDSVSMAVNGNVRFINFSLKPLPTESMSAVKTTQNDHSPNLGQADIWSLMRA